MCFFRTLGTSKTRYGICRDFKHVKECIGTSVIFKEFLLPKWLSSIEGCRKSGDHSKDEFNQIWLEIKYEVNFF
jgi:hypothetical protein